MAVKKDMNLTQEEEIQVAIEKGKKKFGKVYKTLLADETIIWRKLKRSEYKEIMNMFIYKEEEVVKEDGAVEFQQVVDEDATFDARQEAISNKVILYPDNIVEEMAAVADIISTECMIKSGFGEAPTTEEC